MTSPAIDTGLEQRIEAIRNFNRMYMHKIGILAENIFGSSFTAAEVRVINELMKCETTASNLARDLHMDGGYLSRILNGFEKQGLITKERSKEDARQRRITLTKKGLKTGQEVNLEAQKIMIGIVSPLPVEEQIRLVAAMAVVDRIVNGGIGLNPTEPIRAAFTLRAHRIGDIGRIIHCHAVQFAADHGLNHEFEALVAEKSGDFIRNYNHDKERCLVAEIDGRLVGSIFLCAAREKEGVAEIKLPFVAPEARGMGIGTALLNEILKFAGHAGYKKVIMRTENVPNFASAMFEAAGMKIVQETPHFFCGQNLVRQDWEMVL